jgi:hypothetical protein
MIRRASPRTLGLLGAAGCALALLLAAIDTSAAFSGWLAGFVLWSAACLGGLALRMMARLIPGAWRAEVVPTAEMLTTLLPLVALAVLPVLIGAHALYPWLADPTPGGFRGVYLSIWFFSSRSILFLVGAMALGFLLLTRPAWSLPLAAGGLIAFVLFDTAVMVDWLMSLEPEFHSSGFGLYAFSIQMSIALMIIAAIRLIADPTHAQTGLLGALMLVSLLLWEYFAFMQYFIIWSENLPKAVAWYQHRGNGIWSAAEYAIAVLNLAPTVLLVFAPVRRSRTCLLAIVAAVLLAKAIEVAWLVFPAVHASLALSLAAMMLAVMGLSLTSVGLLAWLARAPRFLARGAVH